MAKFYGMIGFAQTKEEAPGVWVDSIIEKPYTGDVLKKISRWGQSEGSRSDSGDSLNPNLTITDTISIIGDNFTLENVFAMKYVVWRGSKWQITSIDFRRPRLVLSIGGLYNGSEN